MTNVKTYKDGSRLVIVVENCTGPLAEKVNNFLLDILGAEPPRTVPAVVPQEIREEPIPDTTIITEITETDPSPFKAPSSTEEARSYPVEGASGSLGRALDSGDTTAIVKLSTKTHLMDESLRYTVLELCKQYMLDDCIKRDPADASLKEITRFIGEYTPLIRACIQELLKQAGYADIKTYLECADIEQLRGAYQAVLDCIISRIQSD